MRARGGGNLHDDVEPPLDMYGFEYEPEPRPLETEERQQRPKLPGHINSKVVPPKLSPRSNSNKIDESRARALEGAHSVSGVVVPRLRLEKAQAPRTNSNKIRDQASPCEDSDSRSRVESSLGQTPLNSTRNTPRQQQPSQQLTPRQQNIVVVSLAEVKQELLSSDLRQMIREELKGALHDERLNGEMCGMRSSADKEEPDPGCAAVPWRDSPDALRSQSEMDDEFPHHIREDAEDLLRLGEDSDDIYTGRSTKAKQRAHGNPMGIEKSGISMLDVTSTDISAWDRLMVNIQERLNIVGTKEPPQRHDPLSRVADSVCFHVLVHIVIMVNIVFMAYEADYSVEAPNNEIELVIRIAETIFVLFYFVEFMVKFARARWLYFYGIGYGWNMIDFIVLVFSVPVVLQIDGGFGALPGKIIRILRLSRALRVLQLVSFFKKLSALLHSLAASVSTLICSITLLVVFLFMFALFFVMRVGQMLREETSVVSARDKVVLLNSFGNILTTMLTLFKASTGGTDWSEEFDVLGVVDWLTQAMFVGFIAFSQMALLNIILGMFVEQAMKSMASDKLELARQHFHDQNEFRKTTRELFHLAGVNDDGKISLEQWQGSLHKKRLYSFLDLHGFQPNEVDKYVEMLCKASVGGHIEVNHFVNACIRMKGGASSFSVYEVLLAISELEEKLEKVQSRIINKMGPSRTAPASRGTSRESGDTRAAL